VYAHDTREKMARMTCLPEDLKARRYYLPTEEGTEGIQKERLERSRAFRLGT
ncbi:MAG: replication-associated recombination protein A, partial [Acetatifactor sp.]|nr:replication-associated recombination protein A [Acetatifactor sp.]